MVPALISATVAFAVLIISQWVIFRRERSRLFLGKLEDLYILSLELEERNLRRFEPVMQLLKDTVLRGQDSGLLRAKLRMAIRERGLSPDQLMAVDLLARASLLIDFYFPQLRRELDEISEANSKCINILHTTTTEVIDDEHVTKAMTSLAGRTAVLEKRILAERPALTKTFMGDYRAWFERTYEG